MPPRTLRSAQGSQNSSAAGSTPAQPPLPAPTSSRSEATLSPAPSTSTSPDTPRGPPVTLASIERGEHGAEELLEEMPPTADDHRRLEDLVARLSRQLEDLQRHAVIPEQLPERHVTIERDTPARDYSMTPSHPATDLPRSRIKSSDLPKFHGKDHEDVDQWIEKVNAIYEYSGMRDNELLQHLPMILQGNALQWFTQLGARRHRFVNWQDWQDAIRNAFYLPNHKANLRRQCLYRTLRANESFADYYQDKLRLQAYVFPASTPDHDLIEDIIEGIPLSMQPLIKASISYRTTLEDFRRILIDLEPGLRNRKVAAPANARITTENSTAVQRAPSYLSTTHTRVTKPEGSYVASNSTKSSVITPPSACYNCGGNHWRRDCPHEGKTRDSPRTEQSKAAPSSVSESNRTQMNGNKWRSFQKATHSMITRSVSRAQRQTAATAADGPTPTSPAVAEAIFIGDPANSPSADPHALPGGIPSGIPSSVGDKVADKKTDALSRLARPVKTAMKRKGKTPARNSAAMPAAFNPIGSQSPDPQEIVRHAVQSKNIPTQPDCPNDWQDKTPAFSLARLGGPHPWDYPVCIDSGSSISLIDDAFAREYLPYLTRNRVRG